MKIGILSPLTITDFSDYFPDIPLEKIPTGLRCSIITQLIKYYLSLGHEVVIATLDKDIKKEMLLKGNCLTIYVGKYGRYGKIRAATGFYFEIQQMKKFFEKNSCDIYHAHWSYEFALAALKVNPDRTLVTLHDWPYVIYDIMHDFYRKMRLKMSLKVFEKGQNFTCVSEYIYECFAKNYPKKKAEVIYNGIEQSEFYTGEKQLNQAEPFIITANQGFNDLKNSKAAMLAFIRIREKFPGAVMHMYGLEHEKDGPAYKWAKEQGCEAGICFEGEVSREVMLNAFRKADLLIHASLQEALSMTVMESMFSKTPVLAGAKSGGIPHMLQFGRLGGLADISDPEEIAKKAIWMLENKEVWNTFSARAYQEAESKYSVKAVGEGYLKKYREILEE